MEMNRRAILRGLGGALTLPLLETRAATKPAPIRFLVVGNPFGMHPEHCQRRSDLSTGSRIGFRFCPIPIME